MKTSSLFHAGLMLALSAGAQAALAATTAPNYSYTDLKVNMFTPSNSDVMANGLNASGQVVGAISKSTRVYDSSTKRWLSVTSRSAVIWSNKGSPSPLGMPKAVNGTPATATAWAINTPGTAVGEANGSPSIWNTAGALSTLDTRPGVAKVINDSGLVGGRVSQADIRDGILFNMDDRRATLWRNGVAEDLQQLLPRGNGAEGGEVSALNNAGTVGINGLPYLSTRLGACWLFKDGLITSLQNAQGDGCQVLAIADDDTVVLRNARYPEPGTCNPAQAICTTPTYSDTLWRQGQTTSLPGQLEAMRADGALVLVNVNTSTGIVPRALWQQGAITPLPITLSNGPSGTVTSARVLAVNRNGQILWKAAVQARANATSLSDRTGVLTPVR